MKVGILTLSPNANYGGILQAWALQYALERDGHNAEIFLLEQTPYFPPVIIYFKRLFNTIFRKSKYPIFKELMVYHQESKLFKFLDKKYNKRYLQDFSQIEKEEFDAFVVGSDQVWRKPYFLYSWQTKNPLYAFLGFAKEWNVKKISYAASFGLEEWQYDPEESHNIKKLLTRFNGISVREKSAVHLLKRSMDLLSELVLDPTLLLTADDYKKELGLSAKTPKTPYLASYILDHTKESEDVANYIADNRKLKRRELFHYHDTDPYLSVENWIENIANADMVVTDSYHGTIFSIIFRKPLIFIGNPKRGNTRFDSLIETFSLQKNYVKSISDFQSNSDYNLPENITETLESLRQKSLNFLRTTLH